MHDVFFFTDLHGQYELFKTMTDWCFKQDPECTIIYGGDAADRGPDGYKIIKEMLEMPQIIYLYGNHEDLFINAADAIIGRYAQSDESYNKLHNCDEVFANKILQEMGRNPDVELHLYNGGKDTLISWLLDGANEEIIDNIRALPRTFSYEHIDFCHAGGIYGAFKDVADAEYNKTPINKLNEEEIIWDRDLISFGWETNRICIHGHTPTIYLPASIYGRDKSKANAHPCAWKEKMGAPDKRGGIKIDMDTGMTFTGRGFVLNCLTMRVQGFDCQAIRTYEVKKYVTQIESYKIMEE